MWVRILPGSPNNEEDAMKETFRDIITNDEGSMYIISNRSTETIVGVKV